MVLQNWNPSRPATTMDAQALPIVTHTLPQQSVDQEATVTCDGGPQESASMVSQNWKPIPQEIHPLMATVFPPVPVILVAGAGVNLTVATMSSVCIIAGIPKTLCAHLQKMSWCDFD